MTNANAPEIRAVFIDIDGTLVTGNNVVSEAARGAIDEARECGCEVALCTGRTRFTAQPIAEQVGSPGWLIASNGAVVVHLETGETLARDLLTIPLALQVIRQLIALGTEPYVYEDAIEYHVECSRVLHHPHLPIGPFAVAPRYRPHHKIETHLPFKPVSVNAYGRPEKMRPLYDTVRGRIPEGVGLIQSGSEAAWGVEAFAADVNKRKGAETLAKRLGVDRSEVMAIGDHSNDAEMLEWAGIGVAMENGLPEIRELADWVTNSVHNDGVAVAIRRFILDRRTDPRAKRNFRSPTNVAPVER